MKGLVSRWKGKRALVIGDPIEDEYVFGHAERLCPEGPVPVFVPTWTETREGGAWNVTRNLTELGLQVEVLFPARPWTAKTRYMTGSHLLLRVDRDVRHLPPPGLSAEYVAAAIERADVVVVSDYGKGMITRQLLGWVRGTCGTRKPWVVDPATNSDWLDYSGCTVICPNDAEYRAQFDNGTRHLSFPRILHKRGEFGIDVLDMTGPGAPWERMNSPASAVPVADVTGAGDTVAAVVAATLTLTGPDPTPDQLMTAAGLANVAAGIVVQKVGTSTCSAAELARAWHEQTGADL